MPHDAARAVTRDASSAQGSSLHVVDFDQLRMLSLIVEQVGVGVAVVDNEANFLYTNATFAAMHGCGVQQLRTEGHKGSIFYDPSEWDGPVHALMADTLAAGGGRAEVTRRRLDGSTFAAHVTLSLLRNASGTLVGRIMVVADITERH